MCQSQPGLRCPTHAKEYLASAALRVERQLAAQGHGGSSKALMQAYQTYDRQLREYEITEEGLAFLKAVAEESPDNKTRYEAAAYRQEVRKGLYAKMLEMRKEEAIVHATAQAQVRRDVDALKAQIREKGYSDYPRPRRGILDSQVAEDALKRSESRYKSTKESVEAGLADVSLLEPLVEARAHAQSEYDLTRTGIDALKAKAGDSPQDQQLYETTLATREERLENLKVNRYYVATRHQAHKELEVERAEATGIAPSSSTTSLTTTESSSSSTPVATPPRSSSRLDRFTRYI